MTAPGPGPGADDVAATIIAACRETGGDPLACARGEGLGGGKPASETPTVRARHYALHALSHVFPSADRTKLCAFVGAFDRPGQFWSNSLRNVVGLRSGQGASWWDAGVHDRVIRSLEAARGNDADGIPKSAAGRKDAPSAEVGVVASEGATAPRPAPRPGRPPGPVAKRNLGRLESSGYRPPSDAVEKILADDDEPVFDRGGTFSERRAKKWEPRGKSDLARELREAAANTAKMQGEPR